MTENQRTVSRYMDGFRRTDHAQILSCLTDDVEWRVPGAFTVKGKEAFDGQIEGEGFTGSPTIVVDRMLEADDIVIAEGSVVARLTDGAALNVRPSASTTRQPLGTIPNGTTVDRLSTAEGQEVRGDRRWYEVRNGSLRGYISASYATCVN